ncbi:putative transcriptional regulator with CopG/Arc/MetJ DNA-binding domain and metal-binding domain [Halobacteroides halobius DSM 5150]|uniref:Putative nickel-responsive regulator n=1 Tax=Halobacteroides halobius (strain ATCC 35273 / DSM 5150 / MD-1) TaxID=748449 RepID=L0KC79_HALHC|nr:nickel-responsive transcriptional regulator NikR [Halobacteroides halobius]AGB41688.1 putative transcriptional regulator with CopG/Arc/MetJ DNA-binding domain and metal-binding domain [Halobacteroides halobius DSM 5150]
MSLNRFSISIEDKLLQEFEDLIKGEYDNRSEAIRDLIRNKIIEKKCQETEEVIGILTLIYDHHQRQLNDKMLNIQHDYHHLFKSNLHLHMTHDYCLEVIIVKGQGAKLQKVANKLIGLKGVKHGNLNVTTINEAL